MFAQSTRSNKSRKSSILTYDVGFGPETYYGEIRVSNGVKIIYDRFNDKNARIRIKNEYTHVIRSSKVFKSVHVDEIFSQRSF